MMKLKVGAVRGDGKVFRGYRKGANGLLEHWVSAEAFERRRLRINELNRARAQRLRSSPEGRANMNARWGEYMRLSRQKNPIVHMLARAKARAKAKGMVFALTKEDVVVPLVCPVLGIALYVGSGTASDHSPELDRIDNTKGYVKENVLVVSRRANRIKNDATLAELERVAAFYRTFTQPGRSQAHGS
jgi:hypothetical protein